jgi:hypothetical protein
LTNFRFFLDDGFKASNSAFFYFFISIFMWYQNFFGIALNSAKASLFHMRLFASPRQISILATASALRVYTNYSLSRFSAFSYSSCW